MAGITPSVDAQTGAPTLAEYLRRRNVGRPDQGNVIHRPSSPPDPNRYTPASPTWDADVAMQEKFEADQTAIRARNAELGVDAFGAVGLLAKPAPTLTRFLGARPDFGHAIQSSLQNNPGGPPGWTKTVSSRMREVGIEPQGSVLSQRPTPAVAIGTAATVSAAPARSNASIAADRAKRLREQRLNKAPAPDASLARKMNRVF